jgi:hypothetical protein
MKTSRGVAGKCQSIDAELDRLLERRTPEFSGQARRHLAECERCRKLHGWLTLEEWPEAVPPQTGDEIRRRIRSSLEPVSPQPAVRILAARFVAVFLLFVLPAIGMMGIAGAQRINLAQLAGIIAVLASGVVLLSASLGWQMTPGSLHRVAPRGVAPILAAGFLTGIALLFPWQAPDAFWARGWTCLRAGLLMALPAALAVWLLARRGAVLGAAAVGGTVGGFAGLLGATVLQFTCSLQNANHLLVWHGGVLVASIATGALIARVVSHISGRRA